MNVTELKPRPRVTHQDRSEPGTVEATGKAWTPNDLTGTAPDKGMVRVRWDGSSHLYWEYINELFPAD